MSRTFPRPRSFTPGRSVCIIIPLLAEEGAKRQLLLSCRAPPLLRRGGECHAHSASVQFHRNNFRDTRFFHGNSVQVGCCFHCTLAVRNDDELCRRAHFAHHLGESVDVGVIKRSIDFIEDAKGARLITEERDQQSQRCQCFFVISRAPFASLMKWMLRSITPTS